LYIKQMGVKYQKQNEPDAEETLTAGDENIKGG
jgi:hypothetical protein